MSRASTESGVPQVRIFVLDNYDSFTFNLVQYLGELGADLRVVRNDEVTVEDVASWDPDGVVVSPGPGGPEDGGISVPLVEWCAQKGRPLLGVCLGHQAIGRAFGAEVGPAPEIMHGKTSLIYHSEEGILRGLPSPFEAMRYHSLVVERSTLPAELVVSAWTAEGTVMGIRHARHTVEGVQFHPESILTPIGPSLLRNYVDQTRRRLLPARAS